MKVIFKDQSKSDLLLTLRARVDHYFKDSNLSRNANYLVHLKTFGLVAVYSLIYISLLTTHSGYASILLLYSALGVLKGFIGFNIIHDALHGSYSNKPFINKILGYLFDLNGTSSQVWKISHNGIHHTYTNIPGHDSDIDKAILLRFSLRDEHYFFHRFQHWYAPILYCLVTVNWVLYSDYKIFFAEFKKGKVKSREIALFLGFKSLNLFLFLLLPILVLDDPAWVIVLGLLCMHFTVGIIISLVFQLAHIVEKVDFPETDPEGIIHNSWVVHEIMTTANFATNNWWVTFLIGGLNFQIEHHLFPNVCHIHYPQVSKIVKQTILEYNLPYHEHKTVFEAIKSHFSKLKQLGREKGGGKPTSLTMIQN